ncbi:MOSC domain-containing protein [Halovenus marina]|uniref:MOSC domain-containing protein n=1 Tax=Halovenus marina TaxID=3396621 RepID=UPI003F57D4A1
MATIDRISVFPVKGLDGIDLEAAEILAGGTLAHDREFALFDSEREIINGRWSARVHELSTEFESDSALLSVATPDGRSHQFSLDEPAERDRAEAWFADFFGVDLSFERDQSLGYVDRRDMGPSVISTATIETVASWFDGLSAESARRRLRANIEVSGVPAFWEDRFVGENAPAFEAGGIRFEGVTPCGRCVVPERDPDTGEPIPEFRERFVQKRRETFPDWADDDAFDHHYTVMLIARVPERDRGKQLSVGDSVEKIDPSNG